MPNGLLLSSIPHVGAGFASMCLALPPLITYLLALALHMEPLSRVRLLGICIGLGANLRDKGHIDADLFALFLQAGMPMRYAERHRHPDQIDAIDVSRFLPQEPRS